jgi:hypothetical protein
VDTRIGCLTVWSGTTGSPEAAQMDPPWPDHITRYRDGGAPKESGPSERVRPAVATTSSVPRCSPALGGGVRKPRSVRSAVITHVAKSSPSVPPWVTSRWVTYRALGEGRSDMKLARLSIHSVFSVALLGAILAGGTSAGATTASQAATAQADSTTTTTTTVPSCTSTPTTTSTTSTTTSTTSTTTSTTSTTTSTTTPSTSAGATTTSTTPAAAVSSPSLSSGNTENTGSGGSSTSTTTTTTVPCTSTSSTTSTTTTTVPSTSAGVTTTTTSPVAAVVSSPSSTGNTGSGSSGLAFTGLADDTPVLILIGVAMIAVGILGRRRLVGLGRRAKRSRVH